MEIGKILRRIGLDDKQILKTDLNTLKLLINHYLLSVPYENLDFKFKREFSANILKIYTKIVEQKRGGVCYESNTLFAYLLESLGFDVKMIFAKVDDLTYIGYDYPHLALLVTLDEKEYLVDVANGQNVREAMNINDDSYISIAEHNEYKIIKGDIDYKLFVNHRHKGWIPRYHFTTQAVSVSDFDSIFEGEHYHKFADHAPLLVTLALKEGRITLTDDTMIHKIGEEKKKWNISEENRAEVLRDHFDICMDFSYKL